MQEEFGEGFIPFEYHISGVFSTTETTARGDWYGIAGVPAVRIDGKYAVDGAHSCEQTSADYRARIQQRLQETGGLSPVRIDGFHIPGDEELLVQASFELVDPVALPSLHAMLVIYEDEVPYGGKHWQHVVRDIVDEPVVLTNVGDRVTVSRTIPDAGWDASRLHAIAFLQQTTGDRAIVQAARLPYGDFDVELVRRVASLPSGNGLATFEALVRNLGDEFDTLSVAVEAGSFAGWDVSIEGTAERTLAPGDASFVRVRVDTDAVRAVRAGALRIASRASGREVARDLRVFNGARSLLVVDDDGNRTDEAPVLDALGANGILFDDWDSYAEHGQDSPLFEELRDYDVVLWHTGFDLSTYPLDRFDIDALDRLMARGSALCLTSQGFLNGLSGVSDFVRDDLGVASWTLDTGYNHLDGVAGDPIGDALHLDLQFSGPYQGRCDDAAPAATASVVLTAPNGSRAMLRNTAPNGARSVFMPAALNAVAVSGTDPNNLRTVIGRIIGWLEQPMAADAPVVDTAPGAPILRVLRNPVRREARVSFDLSAAGPVRLEVFDLAGRLLRRIEDEELPAGRHERTWQPSGSGIQLVRLATLSGRASVKLIALE